MDLTTQLLAQAGDAMELAKKETKDAELRRQRFLKHLEFYKQHRPYRETPE